MCTPKVLSQRQPVVGELDAVEEEGFVVVKPQVSEQWSVDGFIIG